MPRPEFGVFNESKNCDIDVPKLHFLQDYYFLSDYYNRYLPYFQLMDWMFSEDLMYYEF